MLSLGKHSLGAGLGRETQPRRPSRQPPPARPRWKTLPERSGGCLHSGAGAVERGAEKTGGQEADERLNVAARPASPNLSQPVLRRRTPPPPKALPLPRPSPDIGLWLQLESTGPWERPLGSGIAGWEFLLAAPWMGGQGGSAGAASMLETPLSLPPFLEGRREGCFSWLGPPTCRLPLCVRVGGGKPLLSWPSSQAVGWPSISRHAPGSAFLGLELTV